MATKWIVLMSCVVISVCAMDVTSWEPLREKLHDKLEDIFNDRDEVRQTIEVGRYFTHYVPSDKHFTVTEEGSNSLPSWLSYDDEKHKLHGVPLEKDLKKGLRIEFIRSPKMDLASKKLILNVVQGKNNFGCKDSEVSVASVVFHANMEKMLGSERSKFLRKFSRHFETGIHDLKVEYGNRMDNSEMLTSNMKLAGPGDKTSKIVGEQPGFTVSWKLTCGTNIEGHPDIGKLRTFTQREDFSPLGQPVLGWFIVSARTSRTRRALGTTPAATPNATPTIVASSSSRVDVKPSMSSVQMEKSSIAISPSKSVPPMAKTSVIPTTQPTTTTSTTTTKTTTTTKKPTTTRKTTLKPTVNTAPEVVDAFTFDKITVQEQTPMIFNVPIGLFRDDDVLSISLLFKDTKWTSQIPSWISYRDEGRKIYLFPSDQVAGEHVFALSARDPGDLEVKHTFKVLVTKDQTVYNFKFNMTLRMDFNKVAKNPLEKVKMMKAISTSLGYSNLKRIKGLKFSEGSVVIVWSDKMFSNTSSCNNPELRNIRRRLSNIAKLREDLLPYEVESTGVTSESNDCDLGTEYVEKEAEEDDSLWERILIPVIVIVVIIFIIILILCCVYRRKKKYETQSDKDESFMNQKKPVIFLEEYEEKQPDFVSLKPLMLPNEKPPVQGYGPRGGSPDGPESSTTASTEDDESAPLAPKSPKETRGGYNAPPPYSAR